MLRISILQTCIMILSLWFSFKSAPCALRQPFLRVVSDVLFWGWRSSETQVRRGVGCLENFAKGIEGIRANFRKGRNRV